MSIRKGNTSILEKRYVRSVLQRSGSRIDTKQQQLVNKAKGINKNLLTQRTIAIKGADTLSMQHLITQRFIDMKRLSNIKNPIHTPLHNKVIMGEFQRIMNELQFGFTQDVKNKLSGTLKIEL